jgi:MOSC domain-containing protein YiiM
MSKIISIVYTPEGVERSPKDFYARVPLETTQLIANYGIEGDRKGGHPKRQLNIMRAETLQQLGQEGFQVAPGQMGEQIVIEGIDINALQEGDRLQLGDSAVIEVLEPRNGCDRFEHIQGLPRQNVKGRMGIIARVLTGGAIRVGEPALVIQTEQA